MARRGSSARAAALRQAQDAKAARDVARLSREKDIEVALADYFEASGRAAQIRAEGRRKADRLLTDADHAAQVSDDAGRQAVHKLRQLLGSATEVAALCGVSAREVRALLAEPGPGPGHHTTSDELPRPDADQDVTADPLTLLDSAPAAPSADLAAAETSLAGGDQHA